LAWTTQMWYFTPYVNGEKLDRKTCAVFRAYYSALRYHLGTLVLGAVLAGITSVPRNLFNVVEQAADHPGNPISSLLSTCCACCLSCHRRFLVRLNKTAYMDVAITSSKFCVASARAMSVLTEEVPAVAVLNGAQTVFSLALLGLVSFSGGFLTLVMCRRLAIFNAMGSPYYIEDPKIVAIVAGVAGGIIGVSFTHVFDTVGDTILYCFATEQRRHSQLDHSKYGSQAQDESVGYFGWLLGGGTDNGAQEEDLRVDYAPQKLRALIAERQAVDQAEATEIADNGSDMSARGG